MALAARVTQGAAAAVAGMTARTAPTNDRAAPKTPQPAMMPSTVQFEKVQCALKRWISGLPKRLNEVHMEYRSQETFPPVSEQFGLPPRQYSYGFALPPSTGSTERNRPLPGA